MSPIYEGTLPLRNGFKTRGTRTFQRLTGLVGMPTFQTKRGHSGLIRGKIENFSSEACRTYLIIIEQSQLYLSLVHANSISSFFAIRMAIYGSKVGRPRVKLEERRVRRAYNQLMFADKYDDPLDEDSAVAGKHNARNDSSDALAVSSDTDVETDADADADITYSFDHATGPTNGDHILGDALTRAVERFETAQTEDLVRKEYEILDDKGEAVRNVRRHGRDSDIDATGRRQKRSRKRQSSVSNSSVDDGFEFV